METEMIQEPEEDIHLSDYFSVLLKRKKLIAFIFILFIIGTIYNTYTTIPVYQTSATIAIEGNSRTSSISGQWQDSESGYSEMLTFNTHFKLISAKPVLEEVIREIDIEARAKNNPRPLNPIQKFALTIKKNIGLIFARAREMFAHPVDAEASPSIVSPEERLNRLIGDLQENISIGRVEETRLLKISVQNTDPILSRDIANTLARKYIAFDLTNRLESSKDTLTWLNTELYGLKKKLEDDERTFFEYKQQEKLFSMEGRQKVISENILGFNQDYLETRNKRVELDARLDQLEKIHRTGDILSARSLINDPNVDQLYAQLGALEVEYAQLSRVFKPKHPKMIQITSKISEARRHLKDELNKELQNIKASRDILVKKEHDLEKTIAEFEAKALEASSNELQYTILQRNMRTSQELYDILLAKVKESNILNAGQSANIRIVEMADVPERPVKPNKRRNLLMGIILGLMAGIGMAFLLEYLDQTIKTEDDVQNYLGLPVLSVIPIADESDRGGAY